MMRISICPIVAALTGGNIGQLADVSPKLATRALNVECAGVLGRHGLTVVTGATGALGRHLVPGLVAAGHEVTATTRTPGKVAQLREAGAEPVVLDGLDREAVIAAVLAAAPEVIVHQITALAGMRSLRKPDKAWVSG